MYIILNTNIHDIMYLCISYPCARPSEAMSKMIFPTYFITFKSSSYHEHLKTSWSSLMMDGCCWRLLIQNFKIQTENLRTLHFCFSQKFQESRWRWTIWTIENFETYFLFHKRWLHRICIWILMSHVSMFRGRFRFIRWLLSI